MRENTKASYGWSNIIVITISEIFQVQKYVVSAVKRKKTANLFYLSIIYKGLEAATAISKEKLQSTYNFFLSQH